MTVPYRLTVPPLLLFFVVASVDAVGVVLGLL